MQKRYKFTYDIKKKLIENINFVEADTDTCVLEITLIDNAQAIDITGETIEFNFLKNDGTTVTQDLTSGITILNATNGIIECILKSETLTEGLIYAQIVRTKEEERLTTPKFSFQVEASIAEGKVAENAIPKLDQFIATTQTEFNEMKNQFEAAENIRIDNENTRKSNETSRVDNEVVRNTSESIRETNESTRGTNEDTRIENENSRVTSESTRSNNESIRISNESSRLSAETSRVKAESLRETNENNRQASIQDIENRWNTLQTAQQDDAEVINARTSTTKEKTFNNLNDRIEELEVDTYKCETTTSIYNTSSFFSVGEGTDDLGNPLDYSSSCLNGQIADVMLEGRTYTNLLGTDGNCEDNSLWQSANSTDVINYSDDKVYGNRSLKPIANGNGEFGIYKDTELNTTKYYILSAYVKRLNDNQTHVKVSIRTTGWGTMVDTFKEIDTNKWTRVGLKISPSDISGEATHRIFIASVLGTFVVGDEFLNDGIMINEITADEYNNQTVDELLEKYPYVNGIKSTVCAFRHMSIGKNLVSSVSYPVGEQYNVSVFAKAMLQPNTEYTISLIIPSGEMFYMNESLFKTSPAVVGDGTIKSITVITKEVMDTNDGTQYVDGWGWKIAKNSTGFSSSGNATDLQIEEGSTKTDYEQYQEPRYAYATAYDKDGNIIKLGSLPNDVNDKFTYTGNGKGEIEKNVEKVILDGNASWLHLVDSDDNLSKTFYTNFPYPNYLTELDKFVAWINNNKLINTSEPMTTVGGGYTRMSSGNFYVNILNSESGFTSGETPTSKEIENLFNNNPVTLHYQLIESQYIPCEVQGNFYAYEKGQTEITPFHKGIVEIQLPSTMDRMNKIIDNDGNITYADKVNSKEGKLTREVKEYELKASDIDELNTSYTNLNRVRIKKPNDSIIKGNKTIIEAIKINGYPEYISTDFDNLDNIGTFSVRISETYIDLLVDKSTYNELADAQKLVSEGGFVGTKVTYALKYTEEYTENMRKYTLKSSDMTTLYTAYNNIDLVVMKLDVLNGIKNYGQSDYNAKKLITSVSVGLENNTKDDSSSEWKHYINATDWAIIVPKGHFSTLADAQKTIAEGGLTGTTLIYQLGDSYESNKNDGITIISDVDFTVSDVLKSEYIEDNELKTFESSDIVKEVATVYASYDTAESTLGVFSAKYLTGGVKSQVEGLNRGQQGLNNKVMTLEDTMRMFIIQNL